MKPRRDRFQLGRAGAIELIEAKENHIPVVQNIPLARAIYKTIEIGQEISADLYLAMAEVLAYVYKIRGKSAFENRTESRSSASGQPIGG